jgi:hypothetical protein
MPQMSMCHSLSQAQQLATKPKSSTAKPFHSLQSFSRKNLAFAVQIIISSTHRLLL